MVVVVTVVVDRAAVDSGTGPCKDSAGIEMTGQVSVYKHGTDRSRRRLRRREVHVASRSGPIGASKGSSSPTTNDWRFERCGSTCVGFAT